MPSWISLDEQMIAYQSRLINDIKITPEKASQIATSIQKEVQFLSSKLKTDIRETSPIPIYDRLNELKAFQAWMDFVNTSGLKISPFEIRAQVITQNYICFVYLPESCFLSLKKNMPRDSVTYKCAKFLTDNPIRRFRNAMAHLNWTYLPDYSGLSYFSRKGDEKDSKLEAYSVSKSDLAFWKALSRCVAYVALSNL